MRRRYNMILENWLSGNLRTPTEEDAFRALDELDEVAEEIEKLAREGKHWEAYTKLTACVAFLNMASQEYRTTQPSIVQKLLNWIRKLKAAIDKIIQGIGGSSYSIGVSLPLGGVSLSVSFTAKAS
jgi:transcription termination factor Rho